MTGPTRATYIPHVLPDPIALEPGHEIGRFTVLSYLGAGAMGIVYAAYDPELDRKVALKVLRAHAAADSRGRTRLNDEAQAMAKVSHPNVAVIHEIGLHDNDEIFIAMEFIRGVTLHSWLAAAPRPWSEVLDAFIQAGRGLAAAHAAGLVHRDFKPGNAMIGDDGRVRVLDFGLSCRPSRARREVVGTPAYMPPEQFLGQPVGPASDQFSFCASLYHALCGQLPFPGETADELRLTITSGQVRSPPRQLRLPSWLSAAVLRGLKQDPKDRFASMEELLRTLDRGRSRGLRPLFIAVAAAAAVGVGGGYLSARHVPNDHCSGGAEHIASVWHPEARADIAAAFAARPPVYSQDLWPQVEGKLARYAAEWEARYRGVCQARQRREFPEEFVNRSHACFERTWAAFASTLVMLREADDVVALRSLEVVSSLTSPAECSDSASLIMQRRGSRSPATALAQRQIFAKLEEVKVQARAGRTAEAMHLAEAVLHEAHALGDQPILAEAHLQRGLLDLEDHPHLAEPILTRAYLTAVGAGDDARIAEALALRLYARARIPGGLPGAREDLAVVEQQLTRMGSPDSLSALAANNAGTLYLAAGDPELSEKQFRRALGLYERARGSAGDDIAIGKTLANLAIVGRESDQIVRALAIFHDQLGPAHPDTIALRILAGAREPRPEDAVRMVEPGCDDLDAYRPDDLRERADCLLHLAGHARAADDIELAEDAILRARPLAERLTDPKLNYGSDVALIRGYAALVQGGHAQAILDLRQALNDLPGQEWWQQRRRAELELCAGLNLLAIGDHDAARVSLEYSVAVFERLGRPEDDAVLPRDLARARSALEDALQGRSPR